MKKSTILLCVFSVITVCVCVPAYLYYTGALLLNNPSHKQYPIRGVDVSHYQGAIDWTVLSGQGIRFAFIKATEGSTSVDPLFRENYENAAKTSLRVGAYHFFSYDSPGFAQAENFVNQVKKIDNMLPHVVDVEFYGDKDSNPPEAEGVKIQLRAFIDKIKAEYSLKPIIYATKRTYDLYIRNDFDDCDIWIRSVVTRPSLSDDRNWTFWQYSNRARLKGYSGDEKFIDMNVFYGNEREFDTYGRNVE